MTHEKNAQMTQRKSFEQICKLHFIDEINSRLSFALVHPFHFNI